jgi:hypothetical protein
LLNIQVTFDNGFDNPDNRVFFFGGVPERSKGTDCKSVGSAFEGSNPSPSTRIGFMCLLGWCVAIIAEPPGGVRV